MTTNPLQSLGDYSVFVAELLSQPNVKSSTVAVWSDSPYTFPHPNDASLASTMPHHKHIHPDIKHHRIPAPNMSFTQPNLPALLEEIEETGKL